MSVDEYLTVFFLSFQKPLNYLHPACLLAVDCSILGRKVYTAFNLHCSPSCHRTRRTSWCKCHSIDTEIKWKCCLHRLTSQNQQTWKVPSAHPVFLAEHSDERVECLADSHSQTRWSLQNVFGSASWHCLSLLQASPRDTARLSKSARWIFSDKKPR